MKSLQEFQAEQKTRDARRRSTHKGNAFEEEIADLLRAAGWVVDVTKMNRAFRRGAGWTTVKADFFTSIDIIALRPEKSPVLLIQATTAREGVSTKRRKIDATIKGYAEGRELLVVTRAADGISYEVHRRIISGWAPPIVTMALDIGWGID